MTNFKNMLAELSGILDKSDDNLSIISNASAIINMNLEDINWVGFYLFKNNELILGPFQGRHACTRITLDRGVCGKCAREKAPILVNDVLSFKGHIACDSRSRSEICIPLFIGDSLYGLLDIDSPTINRFSDADLANLIEACKIIMSCLD